MPAETGHPWPAGLVGFPTQAQVSSALVGGKAFALFELSSHGLNVPPGWVLTTEYFASWISQLRETGPFRALGDASPDQQALLCEDIKAQAMRLELDDRQESTFAFLLDQLNVGGADALFAVRSSSSQEDQPGHSFAGGYQTCLGVRPDGLLKAIRLCFSSLFDHRVLSYKLARGLDPLDCSMALIVQEQIASETAGVAFSLNPLNNDYDQAVIEANPGLGEPVVAGLVRPDHWVVDKPSGKTLEFRSGDRRVCRWLKADGRQVDKEGEPSDQPCINSPQLDELLALLTKVEALFDGPVDIEWAIADGRLYLLQARPITAWVPLAPSLVTAPGKPRRLYMDAGLSGGLTINAPISPMGLSVIRQLMLDLAEMTFGGFDGELPAGEALVHFQGGRMYQDLSNLFWLTSPTRLATQMEVSDARMARLLRAIDRQQYRSARRPRWARWRMLLRLPLALWRSRTMLFNMLMPLLAPQRMHQSQLKQLQLLEDRLKVALEQELPLADIWNAQVRPRLGEMFNLSLPVVGTGILALTLFKRLAQRPAKGDKSLLDKADRGFEGNVVVEMNLALADLARVIPETLRTRPETLNQQLADAPPDSAWRRGWQTFMQQFGFRGPGEMDIARPRYSDAPLDLLHQVLGMPTDRSAFDPHQAWQQRCQQRREAVATLLERSGPVRRRILGRLDRVIDRYGGLRDSPKQHLLMIMKSLRASILAAGRRLQQGEFLDDANQVFQLELQELMQALNDTEPGLMDQVEQRAAWQHKLATNVINFPPLIDSRGRILRQPVDPDGSDGLQGVGLSPGVARGRARIVRSPESATLEPGDILIAYATDPGWTPLFANAAAIVLEVGGALQHGALVARELGLPCVAGIDGATTTLLDRSLIEVNADAGMVKVIAERGQTSSLTDEIMTRRNQGN